MAASATVAFANKIKEPNTQVYEPKHVSEFITGALGSMFSTVPAVNSLRLVALNTRNRGRLYNLIRVTKAVRDRISDNETAMRDACASAFIAAVKNQISSPANIRAVFDAGLALRSHNSSNREADLALAIRTNPRTDNTTKILLTEYIRTSCHPLLRKVATVLEQREMPDMARPLCVFDPKNLRRKGSRN